MKFYLDNILLNDEPEGDIITTIKRDASLGGYLITNDAKLNFYGDGYDYINGRLAVLGFCGEIDVKVYDECKSTDILIFTGKIFLLEITKDTNCIITTPLQDNNYYARIDKNKSIKTFINSDRSKNNETITPAAENDMTMFAPATGTALFSTRTGWRIFDVFQNLISYMSDGEIDFQSNLFRLTGEFEGTSITTGNRLFNSNATDVPQISFSDFYTEINKKFHTVIIMDLTGVRPLLRVESDASTYVNTVIKRLENVSKVTYRVDSSKLIATISVGGGLLTFVLPGGGTSNVEDNQYYTFKPEDYTTLGQCNIDSKLDLSAQYTSSSNTIEDILLGGVNTHPDDIFFVDCENPVVSGTGYTSSAILGDPFLTAPPYCYNRRLMNDQVLLRWSNALPNSITNFSGNVNNLFAAAQIGDLVFIPAGAVIITEPFAFQNDFTFPNFDGNGVTNNYGNGTAQGVPVPTIDSRYTCPTTGNYTFYAQFTYQFAGESDTTGSYFILFKRYNSGNVLIDQDGYTIPLLLNQFQLDVHAISKVFVCNTGDYIQILTIYSPVYSSIPPDFFIYGNGQKTFFACTAAPESGGVLVGNDNSNKIPIIKADFEYDIPNDDFADIKNNLFDKIEFTFEDQNLKAGWIDNIKFNNNTSRAVITLRGTQDLIK